MACGSIERVLLSWPALVGATREHPRAKRLDFFFTLVAFTQAVMWMDAAAGELVALFGAIGRISGVSEALLGATVFAWGISVSDLVSDTTVARRGMARAALAACFGGPLFNLLVGLCGSLVFATANHGTIRGIRVDNEIIVLMVCQVCRRRPQGRARLHGGKITRSPRRGCRVLCYRADPRRARRGKRHLPGTVDVKDERGLAEGEIYVYLGRSYYVDLVR